ncbi:hypothetical protein MMC14_008676 [Varicellaria rhodocarpa]|nr:hypothetical protein [Varicellaria rhodocarpa]
MIIISLKASDILRQIQAGHNEQATTPYLRTRKERAMSDSSEAVANLKIEIDGMHREFETIGKHPEILGVPPSLITDST